MQSTQIIVVPAEGDSPDTERWYLNELHKHYKKQGKELQVTIFEYGRTNCRPQDIVQSIKLFFAEHYFDERVEVHAQGGFGASIAYNMLRLYPDKISRVFFVGGAPSDAIVGIQKIFHRYISRLWYWSPIPFFADDPSHHTYADVIDQIRASSTAAMRADPLGYRNQLVHIGTWRITPDWHLPASCEAYFVPNGKTVRPTWWDNSFDNARAIRIWAQHGVRSTRQPDDYFSFYSMMPAVELFRVMDEVRTL